MNKIILIGNLTKDPETRSTASGVTVCSFTIAVNRRYGDKETDFFRINAWRALGDNCSRYLSKGRKVAVTGELQARQYTDKAGNVRLSLDVNAEEVEFLSPNEKTEIRAVATAPEDDWQDITSNDIPF